MTMSDEAKYHLTRGKGGAASCTVEFTEQEFKTAQDAAIKELGKDVKVDGFRPGQAPAEKLREKLNSEEVLNSAIRQLLPKVMDGMINEHKLNPIIPPKVDVEEMKPLKLKITFFERPEVKLKGAAKISVKTEPVQVDEKEVERLTDYVRKQHQTSAVKDGPAADGDRVTMDFWGETLEGKEVEAIRTANHQAIIGSKVLLPGFEDELIGLKAGDTKDFTLTFPDKHQSEELRNKPVAFHMTVKQVETVQVPELTDEFVKKNLQLENVEAFKKQVRESMEEQEKQAIRRKYEEEALEKVRAATQVDLADELIDDEFRALLEDLQHHLQRQNVQFKDWLEQNGKTPEEAEKELRDQAEKRLTVRLGLAKMVDEKDIQITDEDMTAAVEQFLAPLSDEERKNIAPSYEKGQQAYEQLKWQKRVEKLLDGIIQ